MSENPYHYNSPIGDSALFAGRQEAFTFVQHNLVGGHQKSALVIFGAPQMGKSSFLRQLPNHLDDRYCAVRMSLRAGTVAGDQAWFNALAQAVPDALAMVNIQAARLPDLPAHPAELREALLGDYMVEGLRALRRGRHLLLLIDNAERLYVAVQRGGLSKNTFAFLSKLLERHEHLDMLIAFDALHETDVLAAGPPFDPALAYRLGALPRDEMGALLTRAVAGLVVYNDAALNAVYDLTAGHPHVSQVMGHLLFERSEAREHQGPISVADVEAVTERALAITSDSLGAAWNQGDLEERLILTALSALGTDEPPGPVPHDDVSAWLVAADRAMDPRKVNALWRRLEHAGVVRVIAEQGLIIEGGLNRRWLRERVTVEDAESKAPSWGRIGLYAAIAVLLLALLLALLSVLPGPDGTRESDSGPTITLDLDLLATDDAYYATQTAIAP